MAKSWADMSKEEREATGKTKKEYNASTGQGKQGEIAAAKEKAQVQTTKSKEQEESKPAEKTYTAPVTGASADQLARKQAEKDAEAKKVEAKEKAEAYLANHPNKGKGGTKDAEYDRILKEGGLTNATFQEMQRADKKQQYEQAQVDRKESAEAYSQSRLDLQAEKAKYGPQNVYGRQSARDTHERSMNATAQSGSMKVRGPAADLDPKMIEKNEIADQLYDTGYDYSHREMIRHRNDGAENKSMPGLYDEYGGYQNWYDNHSLFSGNFTGSKDLMDFDKVMETGRNQQNAIKNYQSSDEFQKKYGKYDWAQNSKYSM